MLRFFAALRRLHQRLVPYLEVPRDRLPLWVFGAVLLLIMFVGAFVRTRIVFDGLRADDLWQGQPLLTSSDGFYFAAGVADALTGEWGYYPRVPAPGEHALVGIAVLIIKLFGAQREAVFTWMPVVIGPLVALPIAFIGRAIERSTLGLVAALGAVLAPCFLGRTAAAYFDTDMFSLTVPLVAALFLVRLFRVSPAPAAAVARRAVSPAAAVARRDGFLAALVLAVYVYFYDQGQSLTAMMDLAALLALVFVVFLARAEIDPNATEPAAPSEAPRHAFLLALAILPIWWPLRGLLVVVAHFALTRVAVPRRILIALALLATATTLLMSPVLRRLADKVVNYASAERPVEIVLAPGSDGAAGPADAAKPEAPLATSEARPAPTAWKAQDTTGTVAEARVLPFAEMSTRLAGHWVLALAGFLGFALLLVWRPSLFALLPIAAIGAFGFIGGHRFLMYLIPATMLGIAYLAMRVTRRLPSWSRLGAASLLGVGALVPTWLAVTPLDVTPAFSRGEAEALTALDVIATPSDTTISWWDFGYPISYFSKTDTLTDGSRRSGDASLAAEILLTTSPLRANRLARLSADALAQSWLHGAANLLIDQATAKGLGPEAFFAEVESGRWPAMARSGEVYLFLSMRLLPILPVLEATRPTPVGTARPAAYVHVYQGVRSEGPILYLADDVVVDADKVRMRRPSKSGGIEEKRLREVHVVGGTGATFTHRQRKGDPGAPTCGILLRDLRVFIELEPRILETQWAQLYLFENADPRYYEPVHVTATTKIYRFK